jgi:hypothetical protein
MQYSFLAIRSGSPPSAYLDWEQGVDPERLHDLRLEQAADRKLFMRFNSCAGHLYEFGLLLFLCGFAFVVVPDHWHPENVAAVAIPGVAFVFESAWMLSDNVAFIRRWICPIKADVMKKVLPTVDRMSESDLEAAGVWRPRP